MQRRLPPRVVPFVLVCLMAVLAVPPGVSAADAPLRDTIDTQVRAVWQQREITPAPACDDATFLRRIYLDLAGTIPAYEETVAFLQNTDPEKRSKLIDRLLADPRYARHQAELWDQVYFGRNPPGYGTDKRDGFLDWLTQQFSDNTPYDVWARAILKAEGNTVDHGAPMYFVQYDKRPEDATEAITQHFLGIQLQCARCHDHPFEAWSQLDFYGMASFVARLQVVNVGKKNNLTMYAVGEKNTGDVLFTGPASEQEPGKKGEPVKPTYLDGKPLAEPDPPSHRELLDELAASLVTHKFDLQWYVRELVNSQTYQLAASGPVVAAKPQWFERARCRPLSAEEMLDAWRVAVGYDAAQAKSGKKLSTDRYDPLGSGYLLRFFGRPNNGVGDFQGGLHEHLYMNNGGLGKLLTTQPASLHHTLVNSDAPLEDRVERLYLSILSRPPSPDEQRRFGEYVAADEKSRDRWNEAIWVLITCSEFRFNR